MAEFTALPPIQPGGLPSYDMTGSRPSTTGSANNQGIYVPSSTPYHDRVVYRSPRTPLPKQRKLPSLRNKPPSKSMNNFDMSSKYAVLASPRAGFVQRSADEDCLKCMLKIPHQRCEGHKYIRVGGGYRHSYWYVKAMMEEIELRRQQEMIKQQRLEAIQEKQVRVVKTYIRTKSGRLQEKLVYMTEEDFQAFTSGGKEAEDLIKKYLSSVDAKGLVSWEKEEQKAITTYIRTKSGRRVAKTVYVSKSEYQAIKEGKVDANAILKKYVKTTDGETLDGWGEAEMKTIKTFVRTKSGRLVEKTIVVSKEDYENLEKLKKEGKDPNEILSKYMSMEAGEKVEGWKEPEKKPMKVVKAFVRTKSGKLVEQTILMTEEEYREFQEAGGDVKQLKKFLSLGKDDVIEDWEKSSTVYSASDDEAVEKGIPGTRIVGKDGETYEIVVDPITGKKYKKKLKESDVDSGFGSQKSKTQKILKGKKAGKIKGLGINEEDDPAEKGMNKEEKQAYRAGKRREDSESDFSYRSVVSAGGTRHVKRRRKREDGTYSAEESYHSDQDEKGKSRRQKRRQQRKQVAVKKKKERFKQGKRNEDSASDYSYRSVHSAGGTRRVLRKKKKADGTYSAEESYHSSQDEEGQKRRKNRRGKRREKIQKGGRNPGSDSDFSYRSVHSAGGTRHVKRKRKRADGTYSAEESYHSSQDEQGQQRRRERRATKQKAFKVGKRNPDSESEYSYRSVVSAGGTRHVKRKRKKADGTYSAEESFHSSQDEAGQERRRRRRRERKHQGSAHSYFSVKSAGGTRHVKRRRKREDGTYSASESYHSGDSDFFDEKHLKKKKLRKKKHEHGSDSEYSYQSEVSEGGTRKRVRQKRIRDSQGRIVGYGKKEDYSSPSEYETDSDASVYTFESDGQGGRIMVKKAGRGVKKKKGGKKGQGDRRGGGPDGNMTDFSESLLSTDSEDEPDLSKMSLTEKKAYLAEKAKRRKKRELKRRERYGEKYDEMMEKHQKAKEAEQASKSMVSYQMGGKRFPGTDRWDDRDIGLGHADWGGKKGPTKTGGKDGNEADDESDEFEDDGMGGRRRKKKGRGGTSGGSDEESVYEVGADGVRRKIKGKKEDDEVSIYEYVRDADGKVVMGHDGKPIMKKIGTIKKGKGKVGYGGLDAGGDGSYEYKYDKHGNLVRVKKGDTVIDPADSDSDGDYFETLPDGTVRMKKGKKKIDINKLTADDLRKLGINPNMSKQDIARALKEKFGDAIRITKGKTKIGLKAIDQYSNANTDDLADDSDLDTSTLKGQKRVRVLMKKGGAALMEHLKKLLDSSKLLDENNQHPDERDASVDYLNHYRLVDNQKAEIYGKAFVVEDEDMDCVVKTEDARLALESVPAIQAINPKQTAYVLKVLDIDKETNITFRMFAVMAALAERVTHMDQYCKKLLEVSDLIDIERKMELYKMMFYCNVEGDRDANYIKADSLRIELIAGGLNWDQQEYIMTRMCPNEWREVSFLDYLAYIPLFMSMHDKMCDNPLDMSNNKYQPPRRPSGSYAQRDINPLGYHLKRDSLFLAQQQRARELHDKADDLLSGRKNATANTKRENMEIFKKYNKLPDIIGSGKNDPHSSNSYKLNPVVKRY